MGRVPVSVDLRLSLSTIALEDIIDLHLNAVISRIPYRERQTGCPERDHRSQSGSGFFVRTPTDAHVSNLKMTSQSRGSKVSRGMLPDPVSCLSSPADSKLDHVGDECTSLGIKRACEMMSRGRGECGR
jgi:hypothetical protein